MNLHEHKEEFEELIFNDEIRGRYETLHEDLLYTSDRQSFEKASQAFEFISQLFASIGE